MNQRHLFIPLLSAITLGALLLRVVPLYDRVVTGDVIRFQTIDPYYHARLSTYLAEHFPHRLEFDSLRLHPGGQRVDVYPAYDLLNAGAAVAIGLGSPSRRTIEEVIAWTPPVLGALATAFIGLAGRVVAGPWGGLAAAVVSCVLPGGTLTQSVIGMSDHHALEACCLSAAWWILSLLLRPDGSTKRRIGLAALLGLAVGVYTLTWEGGPVLPAAIGLIAALMTLRHAHEPSVLLRLAAEAGVMAGVAVIVAWSARFWSPMLTVSATILLLSALLPLSMILLTRALGAGSVGRLRWMWCVSGLIVVAAMVWLLPADLLSSLATNLRRFDPSEQARTVSELRPLFDDLPLMWDYFGPALPWGVAGLVLLAVMRTRRSDASALVPLVTGLLFIPAGLLQIRLAASASLPLALLNGIIVLTFIEAFSPQRSRGPMIRRWILGGMLAGWFASVPVWAAWQAPAIAGVDRGPSADWVSVTDWLRRHTPERDTISVSGSEAIIRRTGVLNWWDSGYYLTTLAGRVPVSNPSQAGARQAAMAYLDTSGERGVDRLLQESIRTIIVEAGLSLRPRTETSIGGQFPALTVWAGRPMNDFVRQVYFPGANGSLEPRFAYLPAYYRTLLVRLLLADGGGVPLDPRAVWAIQIETRAAPDGRPLDVVRSSRSFSSASAAELFMRYEADSTWLIVGFSPFEPCIPLDPIRQVRLVHRSPTVALLHATLRRPIEALKVYRIDEWGR